MTERDPEFLTEEEAARLWQRAAELQAEAARRAEAVAEEAERENAAGPAPDGYALTHVRSAALEVGIASEFVDAALADLRAERAISKDSRSGGRLARWIGHEQTDAISVERVIDAGAPEVLSAMEAIFPNAPNRLTLIDQQGDPLLGGVLVFEIQGIGVAFPQDLALEATWSGLRRLFVSVRPIEGVKPSCAVTLRGSVETHGQDLAQAVIATVMGGGVGFGLGGGAGALVGALAVGMGLGPVAPVLSGVVLVGSTFGGIRLGSRAYQSIYEYCMRRGRRALEGVLGAVAVRAQGGWRSGWGITGSKAERPDALPGASGTSD